MRYLAVVFSHYVARGLSGTGWRVSNSSNHRPIGKGERAAISQPTICWLAEIQPESPTREESHPRSPPQLLVSPSLWWGKAGRAPWQPTTMHARGLSADLSQFGTGSNQKHSELSVMGQKQSKKQNQMSNWGVDSSLPLGKGSQ